MNTGHGIMLFMHYNNIIYAFYVDLYRLYSF